MANGSIRISLKLHKSVCACLHPNTCLDAVNHVHISISDRDSEYYATILSLRKIHNSIS